MCPGLSDTIAVTASLSWCWQRALLALTRVIHFYSGFKFMSDNPGHRSWGLHISKKRDICVFFLGCVEMVFRLPFYDCQIPFLILIWAAVRPACVRTSQSPCTLCSTEHWACPCLFVVADPLVGTSHSYVMPSLSVGQQLMTSNQVVPIKLCMRSMFSWMF